MKKIVLFISYCLPLFSFSQQAYWQQRVNYQISVSLNDVENTIDGFETMQYLNNSPDTLRFIWIHLWPNAYKNDQTAFSEQMLQNGKTNFYFSNKDQRGYINHLNFKVDGLEVSTQDHPLYIDIVKIILREPLAPGKQIVITTPFHEKLPFNFSRGGHEGKSYQITQWYPKPAVYDRSGWHDMPYLDQGEFFSEFGDFEVNITVPKPYIVAATGELQDHDELLWMLKQNRDGSIKTPPVTHHVVSFGNAHYGKPRGKIGALRSAVQDSAGAVAKTKLKTLVYIQKNVHDFAWFADKRFVVNHDTVLLASGRTVDCYSFYLPSKASAWPNSLPMIKDAIRFHSALIGEYPFGTVTAVEANLSFDGGMEYPTITCVSPESGEKELDLTINHEVGHNWFYAALATNERRFPWMDEGINTYYDKRYEETKYGKNSGKSRIPTNNWLYDKIPANVEDLFLSVLEKEKLDQPIATSSQDFSRVNYNLVAYEKTALWMQHLEKLLGREQLDNCMKEYFRRWQFKHPYPEDFKTVVEQVSERNLSGPFHLLEKKGSLDSLSHLTVMKPTLLFNYNNTTQYDYINFLPAMGFNLYDRYMIGLTIHNYDLPPHPWQFLLIPLYATGSKQLDGIGNISYTTYPDKVFQKITLGVNGSRFSTMSGLDSNERSVYGGFYKISPSLKLHFNKSPRSSREKSLEFRTYFIGEKAFNYVLKKSDTTYYPVTQTYQLRYLNQLTYSINDYRVLYPFNIQFQVQQASQFYRLNYTTNYFFNYANGGGMNLRFFAAKFGYIGGKNSFKSFETEVYQPKLTASRGDEDYTYSDYFIGRNESAGFASQQIMMKDGGLKLRTDIFLNLQGRSDNWVTALNFNTSLPPALIPRQIPLKVFFDIGTYADAWGAAPPTNKFLYVGGLQLSLLKNLLNFYVPILFSSDFRDALRSVPQENTFWKKLSFSIDVHNFDFKKISRDIPL